MTFPIPAQQIALDKVDMNIAMFKRYPGSENRVVGLEADRANLVDFFEGRVGFTDLPWSAKEWLQVMPAWGTYGT
jgi:hypothetical protein